MNFYIVYRIQYTCPLTLSLNLYQSSFVFVICLFHILVVRSYHSVKRDFLQYVHICATLSAICLLSLPPYSPLIILYISNVHNNVIAIYAFNHLLLLCSIQVPSYFYMVAFKNYHFVTISVLMFLCFIIVYFSFVN